MTMSETQLPTDQWIVRTDDGPTKTAETKREAENYAENARELGLSGVEVVPPEGYDPDQTVLDDEPAADAIDAATLGDRGEFEGGLLPTGGPATAKAKSLIESLGDTALDRFVWDPEKNPGLPYDRPEPSAEAVNVFAGIVEGVLGVQYSVEDVQFDRDDDEASCKVVIVRRSPIPELDGKQLIGFKTRTRFNGDADHWRERLFTKARRNALGQDIPPTWITALLEQYSKK